MTAKLEKGYRRVEFLEAGEGVFLLFRNKDLLTLQTKFDDDWFQTALPRCDRFDIVFMEECLKVGGKVGKGDEHPIGLEKLEILPMSTIAERIIDALYLANYGRTFEQHTEYVIKLQEEAAEKRRRGEEVKDPSQPSPETGSTS